MKKHVPFLVSLLGIMGLLAWSTAVRSQCFSNKVTLDLPLENGAATDQSAFGHTVTLYGTPGYVAGHDGSTNGALQFNGQNEYATVPAATAFEQMSDAFTIAAWVRPTAFQSYNAIITKLNNSHRNIVLRYHSDGKFQVHFTNSNNGTTAVTTDGAVVSVGHWTHLAATWDGTTMKLFVDGALEKEMILTESPTFQQAGSFRIGTLIFGSERMVGYIDDIQMRAFATPDDQVACLMTPSLDEGIVLDLPMDASADDVSSNDNDGSLITVGNAENRFGETNGALNFLGTGHVYVPNIAAYNALSSAFTISAWINPAATNGVRTIVGKANSGRDIVLRVHDGKLTAHFYVTGYVWCSAPTATINANEWSHVACTWDGTTMSIYHNGTLLHSMEPASSPSFTSAAWSIGSLTTGGSEPFTGQIDEFRVWDRPLTVCELQSGIHANLDLVAEDNIILCPGQDQTVQVVGNYCSYLWTNNNSTGTSYNINASALGTGDHQIVLEAYDYNDYFYSDTVNVTVSLCTGIEEAIAANAMKLYPNPATNMVTVNAANLAEVQLLDVSGRLLQRFKVNNSSNTVLDVSNVPSGMYLVQGIRNDGTQLSQRLMKH